MKSLNHNEGKPRPSLILKDMQKSFYDLVNVRESSTNKYDRLNWSLSIGEPDAQAFLDDNLDSIQRHILEYMAGDEIDKESGCKHMAMAALRCMFALEYSDV
jgi:hypothetical protein